MLHFKFESASIRQHNSVCMIVSGGRSLNDDCHIPGCSVNRNRCGNRKCCKLSAFVVVVLKDDIPLLQHFGKHSESCNILRRTQIIHSRVDLLRRKFNHAKIGAVNLIAGSFQFIYSPVITLFLRHFAQILNCHVGNTLHLCQFIFRLCNLLLNAYNFRIIVVPAHELYALWGVIFLPILQPVVHHRITGGIGKGVQRFLAASDGVPCQLGNAAVRLQTPVRFFQPFHQPLQEFLNLPSKALVRLLQPGRNPLHHVRVRQGRFHHLRNHLAVCQIVQLVVTQPLVPQRCRLGSGRKTVLRLATFAKCFFIPQGIGIGADAAVDIGCAVADNLEAAVLVHGQGGAVVFAHVGI